MKQWLRQGRLVSKFWIAVVIAFVTMTSMALAADTPVEYQVVAEAGVDPLMVTDTDLALTETTTFCKESFGFSLAQPVTVRLLTDRTRYQQELQRIFHLDELAAARWARTTDAVSGGHLILRNAAAANSDSDRIFLVSHEMVHQYQNQIGFPKDAVWLVEGMADAVAVHVTEKTGRRSVDQYKARWQAMLAGAKSGSPSLAMIASRDGWAQALQTYGTQVTYRTAALMVLQLWDDYGFAKVLTFYRLSVQAGVEAAFGEVFGYPLAEFQLRQNTAEKLVG
ncbi:MAG: hypothetical protein E6713_00960 [Sporomusaceae bacterium]|nr:hypothetical protein [Sporomusaceae bacterium]